MSTWHDTHAGRGVSAETAAARKLAALQQRTPAQHDRQIVDPASTVDPESNPIIWFSLLGGGLQAALDGSSSELLQNLAKRTLGESHCA